MSWSYRHYFLKWGWSILQWYVILYLFGWVYKIRNLLIIFIIRPINLLLRRNIVNIIILPNNLIIVLVNIWRMIILNFQPILFYHKILLRILLSMISDKCRWAWHIFSIYMTNIFREIIIFRCFILSMNWRIYSWSNIIVWIRGIRDKFLIRI